MLLSTGTYDTVCKQGYHVCISCENEHWCHHHCFLIFGIQINVSNDLLCPFLTHFTPMSPTLFSIVFWFSGYNIQYIAHKQYLINQVAFYNNHQVQLLNALNWYSFCSVCFFSQIVRKWHDANVSFHCYIYKIWTFVPLTKNSSFLIDNNWLIINFLWTSCNQSNYC